MADQNLHMAVAYGLQVCCGVFPLCVDEAGVVTHDTSKLTDETPLRMTPEIIHIYNGGGSV